MVQHKSGLTLAMVLLAAAGCGPPGDGASPCGDIDTRNAEEVALCNQLDQALIARVALPEGEPPAEGWPGVVILHGSGGLFFSADKGECSEEIQDQFRIWTELLNERGYAVILPGSFYSRGFCDWGEKLTVPRKYDDHERLVTRIFDAAAAAEWMCDNPAVDCSRLGLLGFSNGASAALMLLHEDLADANDPRLAQLEGVPELAGAVTYYPCCGFQGELANELAQKDVDRYYYPRAPVWVPHAEKDKLLDTCEELRDPQVDVIADLRGASEDMFEIEVYPDCEHGFDVWFYGDPEVELEARTDAQARALAKLDEWMH